MLHFALPGTQRLYQSSLPQTLRQFIVFVATPSSQARACYFIAASNITMCSITHRTIAFLSFNVEITPVMSQKACIHQPLVTTVGCRFKHGEKYMEREAILQAFSWRALISCEPYKPTGSVLAYELRGQDNAAF